MRCPVASLALLALAAGPSIARAQSAATTTTSATLEVVSGERGASPMPLIAESLAATIDNQHAETTLKQTYQNRGKAVVEGVYTLDAGPDARVSAFTYYNGEAAIVGRIIEKTTGRAIYEEVTGRRRDPGLLEQIGDGKFRLRIFPIAASERKPIEIAWTRLLRRVENTVTYRAPVSHARARVTVEIRDDHPIGAIRSPTHDLEVSRDGGVVRVVATARPGVESAELVLRYDLRERPWTISAVRHQPKQGDGYFTASLAAPRLSGGKAAPKDVTLVLDISGSMAGEPLRRARTAAIGVIRRIAATDRLNVIAFDDDVDPLFRAPRPASAAVRARAESFVSRLRSRGGTDLGRALGRALAAQTSDGRPKIVLLLTDGKSDAAPVIEAARRDRRGVRVFAVGLGDVDKPLLSRLTATKRGRFVHIHSAAALERSVGTIYGQISRPLLIDVSVDVRRADDFVGRGRASRPPTKSDNSDSGSEPGVAAKRIYPRRIPDLFARDQLVIHGRLATDGPVDVTIRGTLDGKRVAYRTRLGRAETPRPWVGKLWAIARIEHLIEDISTGDASDEKVREATDLALAYNLVTRYTSFLAIPESELTANAKKQLDAAEKRRADSVARYQTSSDYGEVIAISGRAPTIDTGSTTQGVTIDGSYLRTMPLPGRTFEGALGAAAGAQGDALGVSFSGSTSLENEYVVDGVNTTGLTYGTVGSPLIREFISEIEVMTGGQPAKYGRATGANVAVTTETGTNELHGSVFSTVSSGRMTADRRRSPTEASSIDVEADNAYDATFGFKLGGPIVRDKLWFFAGFAPRLIGDDITKITKRRTDCRQVMPDGSLSTPAGERCSREDAARFGDGTPDEDPESGFLIYEDLSRQTNRAAAAEYQFITKLNAAPSPDHQGQLTLSGTPFTREVRGAGGDPAALSRETSVVSTDLALSWRSTLDDGKTELSATLGWHRAKIDSGAADPLGAVTPRQNLFFGDLGTWSQLGFEDPATRAGCLDSADGSVDPYPLIANCPDAGVGYRIGGIGDILDDLESRRTLELGASRRLQAAGNHLIEGGLALEDNRLNRRRVISGGAVFDNLLGFEIRERRWVRLAPPGDGDPRFDETCGPDPTDPTGRTQRACDFIGPEDPRASADVSGQTINWAAYLQDSWQLLPNLTLNAGIRYEEQRLRYAEALRGSVDPLTGNRLGDNAMRLRGMFAPRIGAIYDWTKEGRSKVYAYWGRFYESIPMNLNDRSFGGETQLLRSWDPATCGAGDPAIGGPDAMSCLGVEPAGEQLFGSGVLVAPGIKPQYVDERLAGAEYEILEDLTVGASLSHRGLGRVIEDVSVDNANTYILANPGEIDGDALAAMAAEIERMPAGPERDRRAAELAQLEAVERFDRPRRDHTALTISAVKRFSRSLFVQAAYTYARTRGNYPGLLSADNGQVDPNISSQYDLVELLANREGPLPQDRPHQLKLDGFARFELGRNALTPGIRFRATSGIPKNTLGRHYLYGVNEAFLLPRGALGRTEPNLSLDLRLGFARVLAGGVSLELFADLFSIFNTQGTFSIDRAFTFDPANPVVGGEYRDLIWLKRLDRDGFETASPVTRNRNFGNTASRYAPMSGRLGARVSF